MIYTDCHMYEAENRVRQRHHFSLLRRQNACKYMINKIYILEFNIIFVMRTYIVVAKFRCPSLTK